MRTECLPYRLFNMAKSRVMCGNGCPAYGVDRDVNLVSRFQSVERKDYGEIPPRVDYGLTPLGKPLESVLVAMHEWAESYGDELPSGAKNQDEF